MFKIATAAISRLKKPPYRYLGTEAFLTVPHNTDIATENISLKIFFFLHQNQTRFKN